MWFPRATEYILQFARCINKTCHNMNIHSAAHFLTETHRVYTNVYATGTRKEAGWRCPFKPVPFYHKLNLSRAIFILYSVSIWSETQRTYPAEAKLAIHTATQSKMATLERKRILKRCLSQRHNGQDLPPLVHTDWRLSESGACLKQATKPAHYGCIAGRLETCGRKTCIAVTF